MWKWDDMELWMGVWWSAWTRWLKRPVSMQYLPSNSRKRSKLLKIFLVNFTTCKKTSSFKQRMRWSELWHSVQLPCDWPMFDRILMNVTLLFREEQCHFPIQHFTWCYAEKLIQLNHLRMSWSDKHTWNTKSQILGWERNLLTAWAASCLSIRFLIKYSVIISETLVEAMSPMTWHFCASQWKIYFQMRVLTII